MNEQLKNLIKMSISDGKISEGKMAVIKRKAKEQNIDEDELMIYIDHYLKKRFSGVSESVDSMVESSKDFLQKGMKSLDSMNLPDGKSLVGGNGLLVKVAYGTSVIAILSTFLNWVKVYSSTSGAYSSNFNTAYSAWTAASGFFIIILILIGVALFWKSVKLWYVPVAFTLVYVLYLGIYWSNNGIGTSVNIDLGEYGSAESGVKIAFGYYLFLVASLGFLISGFMSRRV